MPFGDLLVCLDCLLGWLLMFRLKHIFVLTFVFIFGIACQDTTEPVHNVSSSQLTVITSGGFAAAYEVLAPVYEKNTGIKLVTLYGSSSGGAHDSIPSRLSRGEYADIVILSRPALERLTSENYIAKDTRVDLVDSTIGMAVLKGSVIPDISTEEAFVSTLREARSIGYSASASGTYLSTVLWPRIGVWQELKPKSKRIIGERVATVIARGEVEIGFQQISEILPNKNVQLVGPIPSDLQKVTTFSAAVLKKSEYSSAARDLIRYLSSSEVTGHIAATGLTPLALEE